MRLAYLLPTNPSFVTKITSYFYLYVISHPTLFSSVYANKLSILEDILVRFPTKQADYMEREMSSSKRLTIHTFKYVTRAVICDDAINVTFPTIS